MDSLLVSFFHPLIYLSWCDHSAMRDSVGDVAVLAVHRVIGAGMSIWACPASSSISVSWQAAAELDLKHFCRQVS
jgi:hypothetical protein